MAKFAKKTHVVEAVQFTSDLGNEIMDLYSKDEKAKHACGVTFVPGVGYFLYGDRISFGDYLVTRGGNTRVMKKDDFEADYEAGK